jgi:hypothetical protein
MLGFLSAAWLVASAPVSIAEAARAARLRTSILRFPFTMVFCLSLGVFILCAVLILNFSGSLR